MMEMPHGGIQIEVQLGGGQEVVGRLKLIPRIFQNSQTIGSFFVNSSPL